MAWQIAMFTVKPAEQVSWAPGGDSEHGLGAEMALRAAKLGDAVYEGGSWCLRYRLGRREGGATVMAWIEESPARQEAAAATAMKRQSKLGLRQ
ncbi:hypothetical protein M0R45_031818 [Rubus argutus]|uniref:Uncharacterized protein n=1 Tax=Rubus argutus TaxID=59490 RepID=A0AAW1WHL3_RUBAR